MSDTESISDTDEESCQRDFTKIISDFIKDLLITFPELNDTLNIDLMEIHINSNCKEIHFETVKAECKKIYPERFFDILYQNDSIFNDTEPVELLPGIDFRLLWKENISDRTRETIWKYLQLILFSVVSDLSDISSFGDTAKLFEAIDKEEFKTKLESTISQMQSCFDISGVEDSIDPSGINLGDLPDADSIHDHVSSMMEGKLGSLAREIAEETAKDMQVDLENETSVGDVFQKLLQEPNKLMGLVQKVGGKLDEKIKSGELKESELLAEAGDIMSKMKDMPGMSNLQSMFGGMPGGAPSGGKMNMGAMQAHLERNMKAAKQRERMKEKAMNGRQGINASQDINNINPEHFEQATREANEAIASLLRSEGISEEGIEQMVFSTGEQYQKSTRSDAPIPPGKKKARKKKKKGKHGK